MNYNNFYIVKQYPTLDENGHALDPNAQPFVAALFFERGDAILWAKEMSSESIPMAVRSQGDEFTIIAFGGVKS